MAIVTISKDNKYNVSELYQWDLHRTLEIYGLTLSYVPEIHFSNSKMTDAIVKQSTVDAEGVIRVKIPNTLLESDVPINVYICEHRGEEFISRYSFVMKVRGRAKPQDYIADTDEKVYSYNKLEYLINDTNIKLELVRNELDELNRTIDQKNKALAEQINSDVNRSLNDFKKNTKVSDSDKLDGYHAEDFVLDTKNGTTYFNDDDSITTEYEDGSSEEIIFNDDGSITRTIYTKTVGTKRETTSFNDDGSITVVTEV